MPPLKRKQDFPDPVPKRKPTLNPDKENRDPDKTPTRPDTSVRRLPELCPLPNTFSRKTIDAIERGDLLGTAKTRMLREAATFYFGGLFWPLRFGLHHHRKDTMQRVSPAEGQNANKWGILGKLLL